MACMVLSGTFCSSHAFALNMSSELQVSASSQQRFDEGKDYVEEYNTGISFLSRGNNTAAITAFEAATKLKSQFLASMSHELRTPLNAILGFSELLNEQSWGSLNEKQARFVTHIHEGARHLLQLINDILDLSKIEAGRLGLQPEDFVVATVLPEVLSVIKPLAMARKILIQQQVDPALAVHADRVRFKQILYNLLSNAIKFTPERGSIRLACAAEDGFCCLSVRDTGIGISREDQEIVFQEFRQVGETTRGVKEGTGLGLAITKRLVEQHGGRIWVESEPGQGSCFRFTVPRSTGTLAAASRPAIVPRPSRREKPLILVVDDEPAARELLVTCLSSEGYATATAANGVEALAKVKELRPDAITLDLIMPQGQGFEVLYVLRADPATAEVPVIVVSILDQPETGFILGASEYIVKPVDRGALIRAVRSFVRPAGQPAPTVLVVDDDPAVLALASEVLSANGYTVLGAATGHEALKVLARQPVDAVLLDLLLPDVDGVEVLDRIRQHPTLRELPVIIVTGRELSQKEVTMLMERATALVRKDGRWREELLHRLHSLFHGQQVAV